MELSPHNTFKTFHTQSTSFRNPPWTWLGEQLRPAALQASFCLRASCVGLRLPFKGALYSETLVRFALPKRNATLRAGFYASHAFAWMDATYIKGEYEQPLALKGICDREVGCKCHCFFSYKSYKHKHMWNNGHKEST